MVEWLEVNPAMYNKKLSLYKDAQIKERLWAEKAALMGRSVLGSKPNALRQTRSQPNCISAASLQLYDSTAEADFHGSTPIILNMFKVVVALSESVR